MLIRPLEIEPPIFPLARQVDAITLWPFILYRKGYKNNGPLRTHEHFHWYQARRWGVLPWYLAYVILLAVYRTGGERHPMEREAYQQQRKCQVKHGPW